MIAEFFPKSARLTEVSAAWSNALPDVNNAVVSAPSDLSDDLLRGVRSWQPASVSQQDDITLIVIDVAQAPWNMQSEIVGTARAAV